MEPSPQLVPLSQTTRKRVFLTMFGLFIILVPLLVLYAMGYRFDWEDPDFSFRVVGGMYINAGVDDTNIIVDGESVQNMRLFRNAAYIQNISSGVHEVYVEGPEVITWVKDLPVFAHLVTEAHSFNMPAVPQVRVITEYLDPISGAGVMLGTQSTSSVFFEFASTTNSLVGTTTMATSTFLMNAEYEYVERLFSSSTMNVYEQQRQSINSRDNLFTFDRSAVATSATTTIATTTKFTNDIRLYKQGDDVFATWLGDSQNIPYYYCVNFRGVKETEALYGKHVYQQLSEQVIISSAFLTEVGVVGQILCRHTIRIDRGGQEIQWFDFFPGNSDLILMHLTRGLYVVEVDDRAWQNMQLLYPGDEITVLIDGRKIYIKDGEDYLEVFTEIALQ